MSNVIHKTDFFLPDISFKGELWLTPWPLVTVAVRARAVEAMEVKVMPVKVKAVKELRRKKGSGPLRTVTWM